MLFKRILLPLDGSDLAVQALPSAAEIAQGSGAELVLFEVVEHPVNVVMAQPNLGASGAVPLMGIGAVVVGVNVAEEANQKLVDHAKSSLEQLAESLQYRKMKVTTDIDVGDPATCIVDYAAANQIDLIVMSSHGRTGLSRWAYGSVANKVLHAAPCPVMVVNAQKAGH